MNHRKGEIIICRKYIFLVTIYSKGGLIVNCGFISEVESRFKFDVYYKILAAFETVTNDFSMIQFNLIITYLTIIPF